jgi:hypothetical protein
VLQIFVDHNLLRIFALINLKQAIYEKNCAIVCGPLLPNVCQLLQRLSEGFCAQKKKTLGQKKIDALIT